METFLAILLSPGEHLAEAILTILVFLHDVLSSGILLLPNWIFLPGQHMFLTFVVILAIGLVWIYFQIPNIKKKTAPPNGVVSTKDEWVEARKSMNHQSFIIASIGAVFAYTIWAYTPDGEQDPIPYFLNGMAAICFLTAAGMQFLNSKVSAKHINKGDSK